MERLYAHIGARQPAFQQRPKVLEAIGVYAAIHVFNRVVNDLVLVLFAETFVAAHLIGEESRASCDVLFNEGCIVSFCRSEMT